MTIYESRKKRSVVPFAVAGALVATLALGGTYAGLSTFTTTEQTEKVYNGLTFDYSWTVDSEPIVKDVTPSDAPVAEVFTKTIKNDSSVDAHIGFSFTNVDVASIPNSILDATTVLIRVEGQQAEAPISLRQALESVVVFDATIPGGTDTDITVSLTSGSNTSNFDFSDALDFDEATFNTQVTFNQKINGNSDLYTYAQTHGIRVGGGIWENVWIFPVADLEAAIGN